jgi:hypothetical protein
MYFSLDIFCTATYVSYVNYGKPARLSVWQIRLHRLPGRLRAPQGRRPWPTRQQLPRIQIEAAEFQGHQQGDPDSAIQLFCAFLVIFIFEKISQFSITALL